MADIYFTGKAELVAQVSTVQITGYDATTTYKLTVGGLVVSTIGVTDATVTAAALATAWNTSTHAYFTPVTATSATDTVTLTGLAGMPFVTASSVSGGAGTIGSVTGVTAYKGPNDWASVDNWSAGALPTAADTVTIDKPGAIIAWGLDQSAVGTIASLTIIGDITIGLQTHSVATTADGQTASATAPEYRDTYLAAAVTLVDILPALGANSGSGSGRIKLSNTVAGTSTTNVAASAPQSDDTGYPAIRLLFANAAASLYVYSARAGVGVAIDAPNETATMGPIVMNDSSNITPLRIGAGVAWTTYTQDGGSSHVDSSDAMATVIINNGVCYLEGTQAVTALTVNDGGTAICNTSGTITTITQNRGSRADFHQNGISRAVTNYNFNSGAERSIDDYVTITNDNRSGRITESIS